MAHRSDADLIHNERNTARFFTENRQIAWVMLLATVAWGFYGYSKMSKRKDPDIPVRVAAVVCPWPGATAEEVEQLVTRPIEQTVAQNSYIHEAQAGEFGIKSLSMPGISIIQIQLLDSLKDTKKEFSDINLKISALNSQLPHGAGPIQFNSDFGDTAALMLTIASPLEDPLAIAIRAQNISRAIESVRATRHGKSPGNATTVIYCFPPSVAAEAVQRDFALFTQVAVEKYFLREAKFVSGPGFVGVDGFADKDDTAILALGQQFIQQRLHESEFHPDVWAPAVIHDPQQTDSILTSIAGSKYSYRQLDEFTDLLGRTIQGATEVSRVDRSGVLPEQIYLDYSQARLAAYGLQPSNLTSTLQARNITLPGGTLEVGSKNLVIDPSGQFDSAREIGGVIVGSSNTGIPVYLRDLVEVTSSYQSPAQYLNFYTSRDKNGAWHRYRAITLSVEMRKGEQIGRFETDVAEKLKAASQLLPPDLIIEHTSDQPRQVRENIDLFLEALYEAIILVVIVSLIGFWEWRSALVMAVSIPITLAMTFGFISVLGIDVQQVSIATLIIALGLLVDDPVVANDSINRALATGQPRVIAAWLGPTKLAHAILFATITNIVAYLPFMLLSGPNGEFLYSLPIVMTCALISSRIVSMTFIPLIGYYALRPSKKPVVSIEQRREHGFSGYYYRVGRWALEHRGRVVVGALVFLVLGGLLGTTLRTEFFPVDVQYLSVLDVWLPNDTPLFTTNTATYHVEDVVRDAAEKYGREHPGKDGKPRPILKSLTTFVGGGGPRFWLSVTPQIQQLNYAQIVVELYDKNDTPLFAGPLQYAISESVPGVRVDFRQLQTNPVEFPVEFRVTAQTDVSPADEERDIHTLRSIAGQVEGILREIPVAARVRDDWEQQGFQVRLKVDPDRANLAGVTNEDVARSSTAALSGLVVTTLRRGDEQIPVVTRLRMEDRAQLSDLQNLYVYSSQNSARVPLLQVSSIENEMKTLRINHLEHFRTISVRCFPVDGALPSQVYAAALPKIDALRKTLPPGYGIEMSGELAKQQQGFSDLSIVMGISVFMIYMALVFQFKNSIKPILVFAATPFGVMGAIIGLFLMGSPFGFMAFLGIASLVGVIVSHVIVLFDFIEERRELGENLELALLDAGIVRLRPVLITVGATVIALFPLALHGGPLWKPLCYAQIGGLLIATVVTLLLVPVLYSIFVLDLKLVKWETESPGPAHSAEPATHS
jgi:multidrug efflux pump subunit AcrB